MKPIQFPEQNVVYVSPPGWDEAKNGRCGDLPVFADHEAQTCTSCWCFTDDELEKLKHNGGCIFLTVAGTQPPVSLQVR